MAREVRCTIMPVLLPCPHILHTKSRLSFYYYSHCSHAMGDSRLSSLVLFLCLPL